MIEYRLCDILESESEEADVAVLMVQKGTQVKKGQELMEIATDKAAFVVEAPEDGVIEAIYVKEGDQVKGQDPLFALA